MSCVTSTIESCRRCCRSRSMSRIWRCTMTSSAVTGSSASSRLGFSASAMAMAGALAHAAGELVRIVARRRRSLRPTRSNSSAARVRGGAARALPRLVSTSTQLGAHAYRPDRASSWRFAARRRCRATAACRVFGCVDRLALEDDACRRRAGRSRASTPMMARTARGLAAARSRRPGRRCGPRGRRRSAPSTARTTPSRVL